MGFPGRLLAHLQRFHLPLLPHLPTLPLELTDQSAMLFGVNGPGRDSVLFILALALADIQESLLVINLQVACLNLPAQQGGY